jgi:hypothetical protein
MFKCDKCGSVTGPGIPQVIVPTGFRKAPGLAPQAERVGEKKLCPKCARAYELESADGSIAQALGAYYYTFLNKTTTPAP